MSNNKLIPLTLALATLAGCAYDGGEAPVEERTVSGRPGLRHPPTHKHPPRVEDSGVEVYAAPKSAPAPKPEPAPTEVIPPEPVAPPETRERPHTSFAERFPDSANAAVVALVDNADQQAAAGKPDSAAAAIERALRIEPRNATLWRRLAELRLSQRQPEQAENLAQKSNSLAGGDLRLQAANWRLIAEARTARDDASGAREARERAASLGAP
jgi:tetratricopeptide (TPR) repeat protein